MGDYPDYTTLMQIIGSDIMVPIDLQAAYIMMPIDIQAQYITLDINIKAQTIEQLKVNLVAQTIDKLKVDITAQTIGDINIDVNAQSVGLFGYPGWAAFVGEDKQLSGYVADCIPAGQYTIIEYTVTSGKTLYITQASCIGTNQDGNIQLRVYKVVGSVSLGSAGGVCGAFMHVEKPMVVVGGTLVRLYGRHFAAANQGMFGQLGGYEI